MKRNKAFLIISWILVILWMSIIFTFSAQTGGESRKSSTGIIAKTIQISSHVLSDIKIIKKPLNNKEVKKIANQLNYPVRKAMHMGEYFILIILLFNALVLSKVQKVQIVSMLICTIYAISDEIHQIFTMRTSTIIDVLFDCLGIFLGLIFIYFLKKLKNISFFKDV